MCESHCLALVAADLLGGIVQAYGRRCKRRGDGSACGARSGGVGVEECIAQSDFGDALRDIGIKPEDQGHIHGLEGIEGLICEAEALDFFKVGGGPGWVDIVDGFSNRRKRGFIFGAEGDHPFLAGVDGDEGFGDVEVPGELSFDVCGEADADLPGFIDGDAFVAVGLASKICGATGIDPLADHAVDGDGCKSEEEHADDDADGEFDDLFIFGVDIVDILRWMSRWHGDELGGERRG